jgi:CheY-like chemotaxis protein
MPDNRHCRILVVDDNSDAADMLALLLEQLGHTTRVAHDAVEALAAIDDLTPELAVLDIGLPGMDGYELARRLRANPITQNTCLIALSGYGQESDKAQSAQAGFDAHLVKPIAFGDLRKVIDKLTRGVSRRADGTLPVN